MPSVSHERTIVIWHDRAAVLSVRYLRYVLTYAPDLTNNEARNSNYVLTLIVNEVLSFLMNALYEAF